MPLRPVQPPVRGVSNAMPYAKTPGDMCPVEALRNVRNFAPGSDRAQFGSRPGLVELFSTRMGNGMPVQALWPVARPSLVTGYIPFDCTLIDDGESLQADDLNGNAWLLDSAPGMTRSHFAAEVDGDANGSVALSVSVVAWHPQGTSYAVASVHVNASGRDATSVRCYRTSDGALLWSRSIQYDDFESAVISGTRVVSMAFSREYLFIAAREAVLVVKASDGTSPTSTAAFSIITCGGWSSETVSVAVYDDGVGTFDSGAISLNANTREHLFVAFMGSQNGGTVTNSSGSFSVDAGMPAAHWRAGVMKFQINTQAWCTAGGVPFLQESFGQITNDTTGTYHEALHQYARISELSSIAPHGCRITSMAIGPGGVVFLGRTTHGYGPNAANFPPNPVGGIAEFTLMKLSATGQRLWESTTLGVLAGEVGEMGGGNDIPQSATDRTAIISVAADAAGNLFAAGRINIAGHSIFKIDGTTGAIIWATTRQDTNEVVESIAVDPTDGNLIVAGQQNDDWGGATFAHLWKIATDSIEDLWQFPNTTTATGLGTDVDAYAVAVNADGKVLYGTGKVTGSPGSGGEWTYQDGYWLQAANVRTVLLFDTLMQQPLTVKLQAGNVAAKPYVTLFASGDGRTAIRVGIKDNTDAAIQSVEFGDTITDLDTAAHGLSTGVAFSFEVQVVNNTISMYLNGSSTALVELAMSAGQIAQFGILRHFGFESTIGNARILRAEWCSLRSVIENRAELLFVVCGGDLWVATDDGENDPSLRLVGSGVFNTSGPVSLTDFDQVVYGVDGTHAKQVDAGTLVITNWGGTTATTALPGADETAPGSGVYIAGTTRMSIVSNFLARVALSGDLQDPQNVWFCAVGDADDWDTAAVDAPGRAFAFNNAVTGRIGEPVRAIQQAAAGLLIVGCTNSVWRIAGDPALGIPEVAPILIGSGISGKDSMCLASDGILMAHSPDGAYVIPGFGEPTRLSQGIITESIQFDRKTVGDYLVQVRRDTKAHLTYFYLTPVVSGEALHFVYDERIGGLAAGSGGFFVDEYPDEIGPTASVNWRGEIVLGTRDGRLMVYDSTVATDDDQAAPCRWPVSLLDEPDLSRDTILKRLLIVPTEDSAAMTYKIYGATTPERIYQSSKRTQLISGTVPTDGYPLVRQLRDPCLLLELSGAGTDLVGVEAVEVETRPGAILSRRSRAVVSRTAASGTATPAADPDPDPEEGAGSGILSGSYSNISDNFSTEGEDFPVATGRYGVLGGPTSTFDPAAGPARDAGGGIIIDRH